jgi:hypothetical protein
VLVGAASVLVLGGTVLAYVKFEVGAPALMPLTIEVETVVMFPLPYEVVAVNVSVAGRVRLLGTLAEVMLAVPFVREVSDVIAELVP